MKILVLCSSYPTPNFNKYGGMFFHIRNLYYAKKGIDVTVLNFGATEDYFIDDIKVITTESYYSQCDQKSYDLLISHAPDMTYHYKFLRKNQHLFPKILFFIHGFEVLNNRDYLPFDYSFNKQSTFGNLKYSFNNKIKRYLWARFFRKYNNKLYFVFVSEWMYKEFIKWIRIDKSLFEDKHKIIYNGVGKAFEENMYDISNNKKYDFITIRGNLDSPKYCIDIVNGIARLNPDKSFLIIGKGQFFHHKKKADNIIWIDKILQQEEMLDYLNKSKCGLMPTRCDAQGLMMCEMATYGIPLITSNIDVCKEVFETFNNVYLIDNQNLQSINLNSILDSLFNEIKKGVDKKEDFLSPNTISKEIDLFAQLYSSKR